MPKKIKTKRLKTLFLLLLFFICASSMNIEELENGDNYIRSDNSISLLSIGYDSLY